MAIGLGIGPAFKKGFSWSSYWTQQFNIVNEGHSFSTRLNRLMANSLNTSGYYNAAVSGSTITGATSIDARKATVDSKLVEETATIKNILVLWIGTNDITNDATAATAYTNLKAYVQERLAAGWRVFVYTMTPKATAESGRVIFNNSIRSDLALLSKVHVLNTDAKTELSTRTDTKYFESDGLHPSGGGLIVALDMLNAALKSVFYLRDEIVTLGTEIIDQTAWKESSHAYWNQYFQTGWSADNTKLSCDGTNATVCRLAVLPTATRVRVRITITRVAGNLITPWDGGTGMSDIKLYASQTVEFYSIFSATALYITSQGFNGTITELSIKPVTIV